MTLIYAFRDEDGSWHGDPDAAVLDPVPGAGTLTIPPGPRRQAGRFAGQRLHVLYAACDLEAGRTSYRLDGGESVQASWRVHELLAPAHRLLPATALAGPPAQPRPRPATPEVTLEFGDPHRRYRLTAQPAQEGRTQLTVLVCSLDGVIHGELTGELDPRDLKDIGRLITAAASAHPAPEPPGPRIPAATAAGVKAAHPGAAWTAEAEQHLQDAHRAGTGLQQLAAELGRSENSIRWKLHGLGLVPHPADLAGPAPAQAAVTAPKQPRAYTVEEKRKTHPNAYKPWTDQEEEDLAARCAQGVLLAELAQEFGRNKGAIASRLMKIGAVGPAAHEAQEFGG
jgi:hypothetical protein